MKRSFYYIIILLFVTSPFTCLYGQNDPLLRVEIETKSDEASYKIVTCGEKGVVLFYETTIKENDYKFWVFVLYNKYLQEDWKKDIPVYENMNYRHHIFRNNFLYLYFHDNEKKKTERFNFQVLKINISNGSYELYSGGVPDKSEFIDVDVSGDLVLAGINMDNYQSSLFSLNTVTKEIKPVFEIKEEKSHFESIYIDTLNNTIFGIYNVHLSRSEQYLLVKEFDTQGNNIHTIKLIAISGKKFNTAEIINISETNKLITGTFSNIKGSSIDSKSYFATGSSGFFTCNIIEGNQTQAKYYDFLELENMTGYLKSKEYQAAKKKATRIEDGKGSTSVDFDLLLHEIEKKDSLYYLVSEAYFEEYHTVTNSYYDYYGRYTPVTYSVFDGYKYFNTFILCLDDNGNKVWDNGMEIFNILTFNLKNRTNVYFNEDEIIMAYNSEGKIGAKIFKGSEVIDGLEYYPLESYYLNDKIMDDTKSNMKHWYDNYFVAFGFQEIKNNSLISKPKRMVFYINKLAFQ